MYVINEEKERIEILRRYRLIMESFSRPVPEEDKVAIKKAFQLAVTAHKDARRKSGEPYIYHPLEVAHIVVTEIGLGPTAVICALLHDVVEDTDYTLESIEQQFGSSVARIIDGLTKIEEFYILGSPSAQAENFRKMLLTLSDDVRVILIKLADRLHNMRTLDSMPEDKQLKIASETVSLYAPLAHRLGLYTIKSELEDLSLKYTEPTIYKEITNKLSQTEAERQVFIDNFIVPIRKKLEEENIKCRVFGRVKSISSILRKMRSKDIEFEEVYDVFAIRIVFDSPFEQEKASCWNIYSLITDIYRPNPERLRDWISIPKSNGYESLHTTVMSAAGQWVEVQIRSERMDEIAEKGYAAHWRYKFDSSIGYTDSGLDEWLNKIRELLEEADKNALDFLNDFKMNLFSDEIVVYTPNGELKNMPSGSTVMDFAYNLHTDVGNSIIGAKVNHKLVPVNQQLKSGDQVEIITSQKQRPTEEWLQFCITSRAHTHIKHYLKNEKKRYYDEGKSKLKAIMAAMNVVFDESKRDQLLNYLHIEDKVDLYYHIAKNVVSEEDIRKCFHEGQEKIETNWFANLLGFGKRDASKAEGLSLSEAIQQQIKAKPEALMIGEDTDQLKYTTSKCCNPIPGDDVVGVLMPEGGIQVHRTNCPQAIELMSKFGNRIVKAKWKVNETVTFLAGLNLSGVDRAKMLLDMTHVISAQAEINIRSMRMDTHDGYFEGEIMLYINDTKRLKELIVKLKALDGVESVTRMD